jgi:hypothetical protein
VSEDVQKDLFSFEKTSDDLAHKEIYQQQDTIHSKISKHSKVLNMKRGH